MKHVGIDYLKQMIIEIQFQQNWVLNYMFFVMNGCLTHTTMNFKV